MAQFQYSTTGGQLKSFDAADQNAALGALKGFADADKNSGVIAVQAPTPTVPTTIGASNMQSTQQPMNIDAFMPKPSAIATINPDDLLKAHQTSTPTETKHEAEGQSLDTRVDEIFAKSMQQPAKRAELENAAGIGNLESQGAEISSIIRGLQAGNEQFKAAQEGRLAPMGAITGAQAESDRRTAAQVFSWAAALDAINGRLTVAQQKISRSLEEEFGPLELELQYRDRQIERNKDKMTKEQQKKAEIYQNQLQQYKDQVADEKARRTEINNIFVEAAGNKADNATLNKILNASTTEEALAIAQSAGGLVAPTETQTQVVKLDNGQTVLLDTQTGAIIKNIGGAATPTGTTPGSVTDANGNVLEYGTQYYVVERLLQTANSKTKLTQSEREQMGKFANVVALTENLMGSLSETTNDPVIGYLKSLNPYDFDARAVNAQVTALVPSIARGLYGEVGVLTDQDIERYLKTLPNLRSTADQNKFIAMMTLGNAKRSYEQTLLNAANSGVNVSGFVDSYKNLSNKLTQLETELGAGFGGGTYTEYDPKETEGFEFAEQDSGEYQGLLSKAYNWGKSLFGL